MDNELEVQKTIDSLCNLFEERWVSDIPPDFENCLNRIQQSHRRQLLQALLQVDLELRTKAGQQIQAIDYNQLGEDAVAFVIQILQEQDNAETLDPTRDQATLPFASPWENGYIESFNGILRDELLNMEIFDTLIEAQVLIERWRRHDNEVRPYSSLDYRPPAPEAILPSSLLASAALQLANCLFRKEEMLNQVPDSFVGAGQTTSPDPMQRWKLVDENLKPGEEG